MLRRTRSISSDARSQKRLLHARADGSRPQWGKNDARITSTIVGNKTNRTSAWASVEVFYSSAVYPTDIRGKCLKRCHLTAHGTVLADFLGPSASLCEVLHSTRVEAR
jgi:hypothetical protein